MYKFDSESFIKQLEEECGVEETPLDYEEFEEWLSNQHEEMTERDLKGGI